MESGVDSELNSLQFNYDHSEFNRTIGTTKSTMNPAAVSAQGAKMLKPKNLIPKVPKPLAGSTTKAKNDM